jgi:hypothetical protein
MQCESSDCFVYDRFCLVAPNCLVIGAFSAGNLILQYLILLWRRKTKLAQHLISFVLIHSDYVSDYMVFTLFAIHVP